MEATLHAFYERLGGGRAFGKQCESCGTISFPPRGLCPRCGCSRARSVEMSGKGKLLFASCGPNLLLGNDFVMATVELAEGPVVSGILLEDSFDFSRPEATWELSGRGLPVQMEPGRSPRGNPIVAFRRVGE